MIKSSMGSRSAITTSVASCLAAMLSLSAQAGPVTLCATVSEFIQTESEDCVYFLVTPQSGQGAAQDQEVSICFDDGTDASGDLELAVESEEQNIPVSILIDESSVRKIERGCADADQQDSAGSFSPCVERKIAAFRSEMGEEAMLRMDVISEWEAECSSSN